MVQQIEKELLEEFEEEQKKIESFDVSSLELSKESNSALDKFYKLFLDPNEEFPEGSRHSVIEKNLAVHIVANKIDPKEITEAYKVKKYNINSLKSQIKGVLNGTYGNANESVGELVNWCKEFRPDLVKLFSDLKISNFELILRRNDLMFENSHLPIYNEIDTAYRIFGEPFKHLKKMLCYHLVSGVIPEHLLLAELGSVRVDLRDFMFLVYPTGKGKGNVKNTTKKIKDDLGHVNASLVSYHEEQLIGKVINRGTKKKPDWVKNIGHFGSNEIFIDECRSLLTDKDKESSRNYLLLAMDRYKENEMYKRLTENLNDPNEFIKYCPFFNSVSATQPFKFPEEKIVLNGWLKRVSTDYLENVDIPKQCFEDRLEDPRPYAEDYQKLIDFLKEIKNLKNLPEWTFSEDFNKTFMECFYLLREAGLNNTIKKRNYTKLLEFTLQDRLLRKTCLLTIMNEKNTHLTPKYVELAFLDLLEDFIIELDFVNNKVYGSLDYGSVWGELAQEDLKVLEWLKEEKALSKESSNISIKEFQYKFSKIVEEIKGTGHSSDNIRKKYYKLVERGFIAAAQTDQKETRVWLVAKKDKGDQGDQGDHRVKDFYNNLIKKYFSPITTLTTLTTLKEKEEKTQ